MLRVLRVFFASKMVREEGVGHFRFYLQLVYCVEKSSNLRIVVFVVDQALPRFGCGIDDNCVDFIALQPCSQCLAMLTNPKRKPSSSKLKGDDQIGVLDFQVSEPPDELCLTELVVEVCNATRASDIEGAKERIPIDQRFSQVAEYGALTSLISSGQPGVSSLRVKLFYSERNLVRSFL